MTSSTRLQVTALAPTLARAWPDVLSNAVDPGCVPTKMGGPAAATASGGYWYHRQRREPAAEAREPPFQDS